MRIVGVGARTEVDVVCEVEDGAEEAGRAVEDNAAGVEVVAGVEGVFWVDGAVCGHGGGGENEAEGGVQDDEGQIGFGNGGCRI